MPSWFGWMTIVLLVVSTGLWIASHFFGRRK